MGDHTHVGTGFGEQLKRLRGNAKLSQKQLARLAKMNPAGIAKLEQGAREPSWATVLTLAAALKVSVEEFVPPRPGCQRRQPPAPPAKLLRPEEGRLDDATALLRAVQDQAADRTTWGVLADWLAERGFQAEFYCRRRLALLEHASREPKNLPTGWRHREHRHEAREAWQAERAGIERQYGPEIRGGYASRPTDVLWILWGDPGTVRNVRAELFLHHCRVTANPRALIGWLLRALPEVGGPLYTSAMDLIRRYVAGEDLPGECPQPLRGEALRQERHYTSIPSGLGFLVEGVGYSEEPVRRSAPAAAANIVGAIYTADPIAALFGDREQIAAAAVDLDGARRGEDTLGIRRNPFTSPGS